MSLIRNIIKQSYSIRRTLCSVSKEGIIPSTEEPEIPKVETILVEKNNNVTLIGINRPDKRNSINVETAQKLTEAIENFENDPEAAIGVLYGVGGNFCAGYDLKEISSDKQSATLILRSEGAMGPTRRLIRKPLIGAINGYCVAGGLELALLCDLRVMECDAVMGFYNRRFGVPLVDGGTVRLAPIVGLSRALDLILTGRKVTANEALEIGLANRIVDTGTSLGQALNLANSIAKFPKFCIEHDRNSLFNAVFDANNKTEALDYELMSVNQNVLDEAKSGSLKFIEDKIGRHGSFGNLTEKATIAEWEKEK